LNNISKGIFLGRNYLAPVYYVRIGIKKIKIWKI
jgi:hypothetical protein